MRGQALAPPVHRAPEPAGYDYFHELINVDEGSRCGGGIAWAMMGGLGIGMPPVLNFGIPGNPALQERVVRECLAGEKIICLCITEPGAGSDVSNLQCTARDAGDHFVVDGNKKWITNGIYADYFTVAVRTGPPGSAHKGLSMLLLEKSMPGITVTKMDCMGVWPSGTTYIEFDGVKVPKANVVGKLNEGFKQVMYNFNHERWLLAGQAARMARTCVEESLAFARSRRTFGKFLIEHQAIQHKIGEMARQCEGLQAWLENVTFQMNTMSKEEQNRKLGGHIALLKLSSSRVAEFCASSAMQVLGGAGYAHGEGRQGGAHLPRGQGVRHPGRIGGDHAQPRRRAIRIVQRRAPTRATRKSSSSWTSSRGSRARCEERRAHRIRMVRPRASAAWRARVRSRSRRVRRAARASGRFLVARRMRSSAALKKKKFSSLIARLIDKNEISIVLRFQTPRAHRSRFHASGFSSRNTREHPHLFQARRNDGRRRRGRGGR